VGRTSGHLSIWDVESRQLLLAPTVSTQTIYSTAFSANGALLAYGDGSGKVGILHVGQHLQAGAEQLAGSRRSSGAGSATSSSGSATFNPVYEPSPGPPPGLEHVSLRQGSVMVTCCAFNAAGTKLATGGGDGRVMLWDLAQPDADTHSRLPGLSRSFVAEQHSRPVRSCTFWPGQPYDRLISCAADGIAITTELLVVQHEQGEHAKQKLRYPANMIGGRATAAHEGEGLAAVSSLADLTASLSSGAPMLLHVHQGGQAATYVTSHQAVCQLPLSPGGRAAGGPGSGRLRGDTGTLTRQPRFRAGEGQRRPISLHQGVLAMASTAANGADTVVTLKSVSSSGASSHLGDETLEDLQATVLQACTEAG
jgi:hypothetical protein